MRLLIPIFILLSLLSCKKEEEYVLAEIQIFSPRNGALYNAGDTVWIEAKINSTQQLSSAKVSLFERSSKRTVGDIQYFQLNDKEFYLKQPYVLKSKGLDKRDYYFELSVGEGKAESVAFASIQIQSKLEERAGLLFATYNSSAIGFYKLVDTNNFEKCFSIQATYAAAEINVIDQQLWFLPKGKKDLMIYDLESHQLLHTIPAPSTQSVDAFSFLYYDNRQLFVGMNNESIEGYNYQFTKNFIYSSSENYHPKYMAANEEHLLVVEKGQQFDRSRIRLLYRVSGGLISSSILQKDIVGIQMISKDRAYLIAKINNGIEVLDYDVQRGATIQLLQKDDANEDLVLFEKLKNGDYALVTNQSIMTYSSSFQLIDAKPHAVDFAYYDDLENELLIVKEDSLFILDAGTLLQKRKIEFPSKIEAAFPWNI